MTGYDAVPAASATLAATWLPCSKSPPTCVLVLCATPTAGSNDAREVCARELGIEIRVRAQSSEAFVDCATVRCLLFVD